MIRYPTKWSPVKRALAPPGQPLPDFERADEAGRPADGVRLVVLAQRRAGCATARTRKPEIQQQTALSTGSKVAWAILLVNLPWPQGRVLYAAQLLLEKCGAEYQAYCRRVRRWL